MLTQVVIQETVLDLIDGLPRFDRDLLESYPDQDGTPDVIAHDARFAALTAFQTSDLFGLAMKLLNLPTPAVHLLNRRRLGLSRVVGHDVVRALGRQRYSEQFHFVIFGEALDFDRLAMR